MTKHVPIPAKAAAKARRKARNAKRLKHWQGGRVETDLKKRGLLQQELQSIEGFFGSGEIGGTFVFIHVSKVPGQAKGRTYYNPLKRARQQERTNAKKRRKVLLAMQRMGVR